MTDQRDNTRSPTDYKRAHNILDELGVPSDHRIRGLVSEVGNDTSHRAGDESFSAALAYLVTQCDREWEKEVSQKDVAKISGRSESTIRQHYQEIARGLDNLE